MANSDIAVGVVEKLVYQDGKILPTPSLPLSGRDAKVGDTLQTYAFPQSVNSEAKIEMFPKQFEGIVTNHFPNGRDKVILPNPCYETQMPIRPGASGGPAINLLGSVVGINSTSFDVKDGLDVSYISKLDGIEHFNIPVGSLEKMISIGDLLKCGIIRVHHWDNQGNERLSGSGLTS